MISPDWYRTARLLPLRSFFIAPNFERFPLNGLNFYMYIKLLILAAVPCDLLRTGASFSGSLCLVFPSSTALIQLSAGKASIQQSSRAAEITTTSLQHGCSNHVLLESESDSTVPRTGLVHVYVHRRHSMMHDSILLLILTFIKTSTQVAWQIPCAV